MMKVNERRKRRFSAEFRKEQAMRIEQGEFTIPEMCRMYDVCYDTVKNWVKRYGKNPYPETKWIVSDKDINRLRELEDEVDQLKKIIGEQHIRILYKDKLLELAKEKLGDDFEKKC